MWCIVLSYCDSGKISKVILTLKEVSNEKKSLRAVRLQSVFQCITNWCTDQLQVFWVVESTCWNCSNVHKSINNFWLNAIMQDKSSFITWSMFINLRRTKVSMNDSLYHWNQEECCSLLQWMTRLGYKIQAVVGSLAWLILHIMEGENN